MSSVVKLLPILWLALAQAACLTRSTSRVALTGHTQLVPTTETAQPFRAGAFEVLLDERKVRVKFSRHLQQRCQRRVERRGMFNGLAFLGDLAIASAMLSAGAQLNQDCLEARCKGLALGAGVAGLTYGGLTFLQREEMSTAGGWELVGEEACSVHGAAGGSLDLIGTTKPQRLAPTAKTREIEAFELTVPLEEALVASLRTPNDIVALTEVFPQLRELAEAGSASVVAETVMPRGFAIKANQDTPIEVTLRNTGTSPVWARPRLEAEHPQISIKQTEPARRIEPQGMEVFSVPIHASEKLAEGLLELRLVVDRLDGAASEPTALMVPTKGHRPATLEIIAAQLDDGQPGNEQVTRGNGDGMLQRGEQVLLKLTVSNTGDEPTRKLTARLYSTDSEVMVFRRKGEMELAGIDAGSSELVHLGFAVSMEFGPAAAYPSADLRVRITDETSKVLLTADLQIQLGRPFVFAKPAPVRVRLQPM